MLSSAKGEPITNFDPYWDAKPVVTSDVADQYSETGDWYPRAIQVGGAGNLRVTTARGTDVVLSGLAAGQIVPIRVKRVWTTNTTATNIRALF